MHDFENIREVGPILVGDGSRHVGAMKRSGHPQSLQIAFVSQH
jgi:hypothetical protein